MPFWSDVLKKAKEAANKAAEEAAKAAQEAAKTVKPETSKSAQETKKTDAKDTADQMSKSLAPPKQRYKKIVRWLKANYGDRFAKGASTDEIERQLTKIFKEDIEPNYRSEPKYAKGFKNYIEQRQYGDLVSVE